MTQALRSPLMLVGLQIVLFVAWGCGNNVTTGPAFQGPPGGEPPPGGGSKTKQIMSKIAKGPNSLSSLLTEELKADQPAWETIQAQTAEYAKLAGDFGQAEQPKGSKESWTKFTAAFAESVTALDKAAQAKD